MSVSLSDEEVWAFLEKGHTGILTTLKADGWPVSLPIWFVVLDRRIYVMTPEQSKKLARVRKDDRACFLVESGEMWAELAAVELPVHASVIDLDDEARTAMVAFFTKYGTYRPKSARLPGATTKHYSKQAVIRLDPAGPALSWDNARIRMKTDEKESAT